MASEINYRGYLGLPRQSKLIMRHLGYPLFGFYIALVMEAVWDRKKDHFGSVTKSNSQLADIFLCNESTVSRNIKKLCLKGFVKKYKTEIQILHFPLFLILVTKKIAHHNPANMQELESFVHEISAKMQGQDANLHAIKPQKSPESSEVSFNVHSVFPRAEINEDINPEDIPF
jgi:hypothetical protein